MTPAIARIRILEAAERLFAEFGIEGVSLRQIAAAAGQRNTSAVAYHFGSKPGLVAALYEWRMTPINARRLEMLAAAQAPTVETYVRSLVQPLADVLTQAEADGRPSWYLRFQHSDRRRQSPVQRSPQILGRNACLQRKTRHLPQRVDPGIRPP